MIPSSGHTGRSQLFTHFFSLNSFPTRYFFIVTLTTPTMPTTHLNVSAWTSFLSLRRRFIKRLFEDVSLWRAHHKKRKVIFRKQNWMFKLLKKLFYHHVRDIQTNTNVAPVCRSIVNVFVMRYSYSLIPTLDT